MVRGALGVIVLLGLAGCSTTPVRLGRTPIHVSPGSSWPRRHPRGRYRWSPTGSCAPATRPCADPYGRAGARGVRGLTVRFTTEPGQPGSARLLLLFDPPDD